MKKIFHFLVYIFALIGLFFTFGYIAIQLHWTDSAGIVDGDQNRYLRNEVVAALPEPTPEPEIVGHPVDLTWSIVPEWETFKTAVIKDQSVLERVQNETGVSARLIMAITASEQLRLYYDNRESYKRAFEPLKILGSESLYSWGVTGIKEFTAQKVENNLKNPASPFYPGDQYSNLLDFSTTDPSTERFNRIVDQHNHYYSYLYAALYVREVETQWQNAGFDISDRPEFLATLYNIGFENSKPNAAPQVGGAAIKIRNQTYSFGGLSYNIYYSGELLDEFPR